MHSYKIVFLMFISFAVMGKTSANRISLSSTQLDIIDSVPFAPNVSEGWTALQSYLHQSGDIVIFEVLFSRTVPEGNDWTRACVAGIIDSAYAPPVRIDFEYQEPHRKWAVIITPDGKCYLRWIGGMEPDRNSLILPFFSKYKK